MGGGGPHRPVGVSPEPGLGAARPVLSPRPRPAEPGAYLPAPGSPELPRRPCRPKRAPNSGAPPAARAPTQVRDTRRERPAGAVRPLPLSL